jgi:toxin ParE1/3/4
MKIVWSRRAIRHLVELRRFISSQSEQNAALVAERILSSVELLASQPLIGRVGRISGTMELVVPKTPFIVVYRIRAEIVELLAVFRGRRRWPKRL